METKDRLQTAADQVNEAERLGEMAKSTREGLSSKDFAIPKERLFPIQDAKQAMTALTYATWPKNRKHRDTVFKAVQERYPEVWAKFRGKGKRKRRNESIGTLGDNPAVRERLGAVRELLADGDRMGGGRPRSVPGATEDPNSIAAMFAQERELKESRTGFGAPMTPAVVDVAHKGAAGLLSPINAATKAVNMLMRWTRDQASTDFTTAMDVRLQTIFGHLQSAYGEAVQLRDDLKVFKAESERFAKGGRR